MTYHGGLATHKILILTPLAYNLSPTTTPVFSLPDHALVTLEGPDAVAFAHAQFANDVAARAANNNAIPPDLSLMTKARHDGSNYVYSLLTGYTEPDAAKAAKVGFETPVGLYFNKHFPNVNIAMAPPLAVDGQVTYADGTNATIPQMATDVAAFLTWTAEPSLVQRKQTGWFVIGFLLFATVLAFLSYKQIWAGMKPKKK